MSKIQETTTGSEMGIFSETDQSISDTEMATTQTNGTTPTGEAEQVKNYLANVATMKEGEKDPEAKEAHNLEQALKSIAYASSFNVFTNEQFVIPKSAYVKGNGGSYPFKLEQLKNSAEALKVTASQAWQVAKALRA